MCICQKSRSRLRRPPQRAKASNICVLCNSVRSGIFADAHGGRGKIANKKTSRYTQRDVFEWNAKDDAQDKCTNKKNCFFDNTARNNHVKHTAIYSNCSLTALLCIICNFKAIDCRNSSRQLVSFPFASLSFSGMPPISLGCFMISIRIVGVAAHKYNGGHMGGGV